MEFFASLSKMSMVLVAFAAGYLANKLGIMGGETDQKMTKLILTITMPAMALGAVATSEELPDAAELLGLLEVTVAFYGIAFLLAAVLPRFLGGTDGQRSVWRFGISFSNVGFIGIPVATEIRLVEEDASAAEGEDGEDDAASEEETDASDEDAGT